MEALTPLAEVFSYPPPVDIEKVVHRRTESLCANSPTSRSLSLSLRPKSVGGHRSWQRRNTHDQLDERREGLQEETFLMSSILSTFVFLYVSSSLDSLTLRSGVLGEERQVTVFAVRASRYPTQRGGREENTTFVFRLCKDLIQISKNTITDSCRCRLHRSFLGWSQKKCLSLVTHSQT